MRPGATTPDAPGPGPFPPVWVLIPARDEAAVLPVSLPSVLGQDYSGPLAVILVDDGSTDGTADVAHRLAGGSAHAAPRLTVRPGVPLAPGWTGKLWALEQGLREADRRGLAEGDWLLLTDADIVHPPGGVRRLVARAERDRRDLVSLMVALRCESSWERLLIPAFVFFFGLIYPFRWVNDDRRKTAGAAGGCILVRAGALRRAGGLAAIRGEIIDDCALARAVKSSGGRLWLGHGTDTRSVRAYDTLGEIWRMVSRTADTQLRHSLPLLAGTVLALGAFLVAPPLLTIVGAITGKWLLAGTGAAAWLAWALAYAPTVRRYGRPWGWAFTLPLAGLLYGLMTLDSARRHRLGRGGAWKGRTYAR